MRVLYFSRSYTVHDRRFLQELAASPHEIWYLRLEDDRNQYELRPVPEGIHMLDPLSAGTPVSTPERWIPLVPRLKAVIERVKPDLVHAGPIQSCAFLVALAEFHPFLAMSWGSDLLVDAQRGEFWMWMTGYTLRHADMLFSDCAEVSEAARTIGGLKPGRIVQFPWGVDLDSFKPGPDTLGFHRRAGWSDSVIVISTRSWEPQYGILHLLEGFRGAQRKLASLRLVLLGTGSQGEEVERFVQKNGLDECTYLAGAVPSGKLPEYFRAADVYASSAYSDGSSISLLEAMATGLPALVTNRASNREWISGRDQGVLVPFGDSAAIASGLLDLAGLSADRRRKIGLRNRAVAEERANWTVNVARLLHAYQSLACAPRDEPDSPS